jgi:outer membrane murein-binding lipoprotein Lpp
MLRTSKQLWPATAVLLTLALLGCSSGSKEDPLAADWQALQAAKASLDAKRQELTALEDAAKAAVAVDAETNAEGEDEATAEPVDNSAQIAALEQEITGMADGFMTQLVAFLNSDPIIAEDGPTERQLAAIRLKSSEDMLVAKEWITAGGDYRQAISIFENTLQLDPDNEELKAALAEAQANRYMSQERFAAAAKGMTEDAVREALGQPLQYNVKTYEDKGVTAWFYPTAEDGSAAAVWFRPDNEGQPVSYLTKYDAVSGNRGGS